MGRFIGNNVIIENLKKRIQANEISHAHIIVGDNGIGKSKLAKILACNILGVNEEKDCIDIINYRTKKNSFGVDEVRGIIEEVNKKPYEGDKKVIVVYEGNKLTVQAQNALLKTIEEPPKGVFIFLLCESLEFVLDTIKSRCEIHKITPLNTEEIREYLITNNNNNVYSAEEINSAISYSEGIPGKAEAFLKDNTLKEMRNVLVDLLYNLVKGDIDSLLEFENKLAQYKDKKEELLGILNSFVRDIIIYKELNSIKGIINEDKINDIKQLAIEMSYKKLNKIVNKIGECRITFLSNSNFLLTIRVMLIGFMEV